MKKNKWTIIIFVIALAFLSLSFFRIDPDYLWHIKAGEYMVQHGLLTKDVFSWSVYSQYWMSHEWLFEIFIYGLKQIFGKFHLFVYCFTCMMALFALICYGNKESLSKNLLFTIAWLAFSLIIDFSTQARPHLLSNILLATTVYFLYDLYKNEDSKKIYFLPLITILWANVHGGSSNMPYLLCFIMMVAGTFQFRSSKMEAKRITKKQYLKYLIVMILCMVSVNINLHGFRMFLYPYQNMMDTTMLQNITEWRNTSLSEPSHYLYFALLLFIICIFLFSKKKIAFMDFILLGFCAFLGLKSIRFWSYTYIMMSFVVFSYVGNREEDKGTQLGLVLISCFLFAFFLVNGKGILSPTYQYVLSQEDIQVLREKNPQRLFNLYDYGGDLVYQGIPVFIDGRADLYGKHNFKDYLSISTLNGDYVENIVKYDFDYFLVNQNYPIATYLKYSESYELIYQNKDILLYQKRTTE